MQLVLGNYTNLQLHVSHATKFQLHATACHVQLVLGNYTNLQLHVSHATEFQLHATVAKPKISSSVLKNH